MALLAFGMAILAARAEDKSSKAAPEFQKIKQEYEEAVAKQRQELEKELREAKTAAEKQEIQKKALVGPGPKFAERFLELAEKNPGDPSALDAALAALQAAGGPQSEMFAKAIAFLEKNYAAKPEIKKALRGLSGLPDERVLKLFKEVVAKNPDHKTQAAACKAIVQANKMAVQFAEAIKNNPQVRPRAEAQLGKEFIAKLVDGAGKAKEDAEEWTKILKDKYTDVVPDLSIGKPAPEVVSQEINGKEVKLSDLKGKVVVLDIWATWCPPCRAMIPHEREMVERLKDKPFALISISADEKKKTLTDFLAKENMPWTHWWNGQEGGIVEDWEVDHFPTIYVLDAKGIIRKKEIRGEELEKAVNELIKEAEKKESN
jgi:thiol-disulfide isomerase/thioredoxin